jgi:hypothetical protein
MATIPDLEIALRKYINIIQMKPEKDIIKCQKLYKQVEDVYIELYNILIDFDTEIIDIIQNGYEIDKDNNLKMKDSFKEYINKLLALIIKIENEFKIKFLDIIKLIKIETEIKNGVIHYTKKNDSEIIMKPAIKCEPCGKDYICDYGNCKNIKDDFNKCIKNNQSQILKTYAPTSSSSIISSSICCSLVLIIGIVIIVIIKKK